MPPWCQAPRLQQVISNFFAFDGPTFLVIDAALFLNVVAIAIAMEQGTRRRIAHV